MTENQEDFDHRAAAGVADPGLCALLESNWAALMERLPTYASRLGDRRFDDRLAGTSPADFDGVRAENAGFLAAAGKIDVASLHPGDALTLALLREDLELTDQMMKCRLEEWSVDPRMTPFIQLCWLSQIRPLESTRDAENLLSRFKTVPQCIQGEIECLKLGAGKGRFANRESVRRAARQLRSELSKPEEEWAAVTGIRFTDEVAAAEAVEFAERVRKVLEKDVRPALENFVEYLETELLPHGRKGDRVGLGALPGGEEAYAVQIRRYTTLSLTPKEIHETGLAEMESIHAEFAALGERALRTSHIPNIFERLRSDPELHFRSAKEVEGKAIRALDAARAAMPEWFGLIPAVDCVVTRIPDHEAPYTTIAYYRPPSADGSQPGEYRVNVYAPKTRPRYEAEALAFHEAIPGHHLQIAVAMELPEMPAFRRMGSVTAYVEGWALYTERLADEMGLYGGDLDRLGMLSFDAWRASRLVVDTGIHAFGWSRKQAVDYMTENTPLAVNNIDNEVDRYITWPGQALAYKIGQLKMWQVRREAEALLGARFDIRAFHDFVLGLGPVPLGALESETRRWAGPGPGRGAAGS